MEDVEKILNEELNTCKAEISKRIIDNGQNASGKTIASLQTNVSGFIGQLVGASYIGVLERGRKPGKVPYNFTEILKTWATAKGISFQSESDFNRWAWFVSQKIRREGTALFRTTHKDVLTTPIDDMTKRISERIGSLYTLTIKNDIFNASK